MTTWNNADGLIQKFGLSEGEASLVGVGRAKEQFITVVLDTDQINVLGGGRIDPENPVALPAGSYITQAFFIVTEAFTSAGAVTLDLGLGIEDGTYTGGDEDGIDAAIALTAIDAVGEVVVCDGAKVRGTATTGAVTLYPTYDIDTAVFTSGKGVLHIFYIPPEV